MSRVAFTRYNLKFADGEHGDDEFDEFDDAMAAGEACGQPFAVVAVDYEIAGAYLAWSPDGSDNWP